MASSVKNTLGGGGSIGAVENLLVPTLGTETQNGVTCTNNWDGTYTLNGTATARCIFKLSSPFSIASGTYKLVLTNVYNGGLALTVAKTNYASGEVGYVRTEGNVTISENITAYIHINVVSGTTLDNLIVKPMLTTNLKATYKEFVKRVGGFANVFVPSTTNQTINGVTMTVNSDGTFTFNGTASAESLFYLNDDYFTLDPTKRYKLTGCPKSGSTSTYYMRTYIVSSSDSTDRGNGTFFECPTKMKLRIDVRSGVTLNNVVFKPMITESLLPEYFDFVKGVADGITPQMFGCTKMWSNTIVNASNRTLRNVGNFNHGLGVVPKVYAILIDDDSASSASYMSICQLIGFYADATYHAHIHTCRYPNAFTGERTYSSTDSSVSATSISFSGTTTGYAGGQYLLAGHTYKFIVMA